MADFQEILWARLRKPQSIILIPTWREIPAKTAMGICAVKLPAPKTTIIKMKARVIPDKAERAPVLILTTVPIVAPAPGRPPNNPEAKLPKP